MPVIVCVRRLALCLFSCVSGVSSVQAAEPVGSAWDSTWTAASVIDGAGERETYLIEDEGALVSRASLVVGWPLGAEARYDLASVAGVEALDGWTIHADVVIVARRTGAGLMAAEAGPWMEGVMALGPGFEVTSLEGAPCGDAPAQGGEVGLWHIRTPTVRDAIELHGWLVSEAGIESRLSIRGPDQRPAMHQVPDDPEVRDGNAWHIHNAPLGPDLNPWHTARVTEAWDLGYRGEGVNIALVEGGNVYTDHEDLEANHNPDGDLVFLPEDGSEGRAGHVTMTAGLACAVADNGLGGAGVAPSATFSSVGFGFRVVGGAPIFFRPTIELAHRAHVNDVFNNSYRLGRGWASMGSFESDEHYLVLENAIRSGRCRRGSVFVWSAGNSRTTRAEWLYPTGARQAITVGATALDGLPTGYSSPGCCVLVGAPGGVWPSHQLVAPSKSPAEYVAGVGTSLSAPIVAGAAALMLDANPDLTWRDVKHILVNTAWHPGDVVGRTINGAGHELSEQAGFGLLDTFAAVALAARWENVGPEVLIDTGDVIVSRRHHAPLAGTLAPDLEHAPFEFRIEEDLAVEHVELVIDLEFGEEAIVVQMGRRSVRVLGDTDLAAIIGVESPSGTRSIFFDPTRIVGFADGKPVSEYRHRSDTWFPLWPASLEGFPLMSVRHWDERSRGTWKVFVEPLRDRTQDIVIRHVRLRIFGSHTGRTTPLCDADMTTSGARPGHVDYGRPDGETDVHDVAWFTSAWADGLTRGDFDRDGDIDVEDFTRFHDAWLAGCR